MSTPFGIVASEISVVIPTWNRPTLVLRAVESLIAESSEIEIIVVDDGSDEDKAPDLKLLSAEGNVRLISLPQNMGASNARNIGASQAMGRYLAFLDSDDAVKAGWFNTFKGLLSRPDIGFASCSVEHIHDTEVQFVTGPKCQDWASEIGPFHIGIPGSWVTRTEYFLEVDGYDTRCRSLQNTELAMRLFPHLSTKGLTGSFSSEILVTRKLDSNDRMRNDDLAVLEGTLYAMEKHAEILRAHPKLKADFASTAAVRAARLGDLTKCRTLLREAALNDPKKMKRWARVLAAWGPSFLRRRWTS